MNTCAIIWTRNWIPNRAAGSKHIFKDARIAPPCSIRWRRQSFCTDRIPRRH